MSQTPETKRKTLEKISAYKGDRIAVMNNELEQLDVLVNERTAKLETIEKSIKEAKSTISKLEHDLENLKDEDTELRSKIRKSTEELRVLMERRDDLTRSISDLQALRDEKQRLAEGNKILREEEAELITAVRSKTTELRSLTVKIEPLRDREADIIRRENRLVGLEARESKVAAERKKLDVDIAQNLETLRDIQLGGKTIGHYVRGLQKHMDTILKPHGVQVNILDIIQTL